MKHFILIVLAIIFVTGTALALDIEKGEKVNIWIKIQERNGAAFTIASGDIGVFDSSGYTVQTTAAAIVDAGEAAFSALSHTVKGLLDTTFGTFTAGDYDRVKFRYYIGNEIYIDYVPIDVK